MSWGLPYLSVLLGRCRGLGGQVGCGGIRSCVSMALWVYLVGWGCVGGCLMRRGGSRWVLCLGLLHTLGRLLCPCWPSSIGLLSCILLFFTGMGLGTPALAGQNWLEDSEKCLRIGIVTFCSFWHGCRGTPNTNALH